MAESVMYHEGNRQLQDRFDSRRISDRLEEKPMPRSFRPMTSSSSKACRTSSWRRRTPRVGPIARSRAARRALCASPGLPKSHSPTMTATACSRASATSSPMPMSACCSSPCMTSRGVCASMAVHRVSDNDPLLAETVGAQLIVRVTRARSFRTAALHSDDGRDRAVDVCADRRTGRAGAGVEGSADSRTASTRGNRHSRGTSRSPDERSDIRGRC